MNENPNKEENPEIKDNIVPFPMVAASGSLVTYCVVRKKDENDDEAKFLMIEKADKVWSFPFTSLNSNSDLYSSLIFPMEQDLGLSADTYFPEQELTPSIPKDKSKDESESYEPSVKDLLKVDGSYLYPVDISVTKEAMELLDDKEKNTENIKWMTLHEVLGNNRPMDRPTAEIANTIFEKHPKLRTEVYDEPSMDARAKVWASRNAGGVRRVEKKDISLILGAGDHAFNLRVADPYLGFQKQGLGFTWSFFTPKDRQDIHLHGIPIVEIFGVTEGELCVWYKYFQKRGVKTWECVTLKGGDWLEVEPLYCHFSYWLTEEGLGTVFKAAARGPLAGEGKIGENGKTKCKSCPVKTQCTLLPEMLQIKEIYRKEFNERNYDEIRNLTSIAIQQKPAQAVEQKDTKEDGLSAMPGSG